MFNSYHSASIKKNKHKHHSEGRHKNLFLAAKPALSLSCLLLNSAVHSVNLRGDSALRIAAESIKLVLSILELAHCLGLHLRDLLVQLELGAGVVDLDPITLAWCDRLAESGGLGVCSGYATSPPRIDNV